MKTTLAALLLACAFSSLSAHADLGILPKLNPTDLASRLKQFDYSAISKSEFVKEIKDTEKLQISEMRLNYVLPESGKSRSFRYDVYKATNGAARRPAIVLFPPLQGLSPFDTGFARAFAKAGFVVFISQVSHGIEEFSRIEPLMQEFVDATIDNRILFDEIQRRDDVIVDNLNIFGISLGAIRASMFYGVEPRIKKATLIVGGGNLPSIIVNSMVDTVVALREKFFSNYNISNLDDLENLLRKQLLWDPIYSAENRLGGQNCMMIVGEKDDKVPSIRQYELVSSLKCSTVKYINKNHVPTATATFLNKSPIIKFFLKP